MNRQNIAYRIHGHRGCRGSYPENTLPAFLHAATLGVQALELDVVVSRDGELMVSHDFYFLPELCTEPDGTALKTRAPLYSLSALEIQQYPQGTLAHPKFPNQHSIKSYKPTLRETAFAVVEHCNTHGLSVPEFNIEIKTSYPHDSTDSLLHPSIAEYAAIIDQTIDQLPIGDHCFIQSFDPRILEALNDRGCRFPLVFLSEDTEKDIATKLNELTFTPAGYAPKHVLIDEATVAYCKKYNMRLLAWTINETSDMERMLSLGVKEIITDYPELALPLIQQ
jgi:glycerophosphoryl diester phosphodiesterase